MKRREKSKTKIRARVLSIDWNVRNKEAHIKKTNKEAEIGGEVLLWEKELHVEERGSGWEENVEEYVNTINNN